MTHELTPAQRALRRAAGQLGGLTGHKDPAPATRQRLVNLGAELDAAGHLVPGPALTLARRRMAAAARLAKARKALARAQRGPA